MFQGEEGQFGHCTVTINAGAISTMTRHEIEECSAWCRLLFLYTSRFSCQVPESLHGINHGRIRLVADEILWPYRAEKLDAPERRAPGQLYIETGKVAFGRFSVDNAVSL